MINENAPLPHDVLVKIPAAPKVFEHAAPVNGTRWRLQLAARSLPPIKGKLATAGHTIVSRQEVFEFGDQPITADNAFQLLYYSLAWGLGTKAPYLHKRLEHLAAQQETAGDLLVSAWTMIRDGAAPREAYSCLTTDHGKGRWPCTASTGCGLGPGQNNDQSLIVGAASYCPQGGSKQALPAEPRRVCSGRMAGRLPAKNQPP